MKASKKSVALDVNKDLINVNNDLVIAAELAVRSIQMTNEYFISENLTPQTAIIDLLKHSIKKSMEKTNEYFITKNITPQTSIIDLLKISIEKAKHESV